MKEIEVGKQRILSAPVGADNIKIYHEWQDEIVASATVVGTYSFTPDSIGIHKIVWFNGTTRVETEFYSCVLPLVKSSDFFSTKEELEPFEDDFPELERVARFMVESYTGQRFGPYIEKTVVIQGDGGDSLVLPLRLMTLISVTDSYGQDISDFLQVSPNHDEIIQSKPMYRNSALDFDVRKGIVSRDSNRFADYKDFSIVGNWGWDYVPPEVTQGASLLIEDALANPDAYELRKHGVFEATLGDFSLKLNADQWGTTGNVQADQILSKYVNYGIELI